MNRQRLSQAIEDYLKTIYELTMIHGRASTNQIADALKVKPASVTGMIQKLASTEPPLVEYIKHQGVVLTPEGQNAALETLRHHRLLEYFLSQILGFSWDEVHEEADRLEHVISEKFERRLAEFLGNPSHDPHGHPIPAEDLSMPACTTLCLADLQVSQTAVVEHVQDSDPELLRYLAEIGLIPGAGFEVLAYSPFDHNLTILVAGRDDPVVLGTGITCQIFVAVVS